MLDLNLHDKIIIKTLLALIEEITVDERWILLFNFCMTCKNGLVVAERGKKSSDVSFQLCGLLDIFQVELIKPLNVLVLMQCKAILIKVIIDGSERITTGLLRGRLPNCESGGQGSLLGPVQNSK